MPLPVSRYQSPAGAMPAVSQSASSAWWVPESSPREAKGASAVGDRRQRGGGVRRVRDAGRVAAGPTMTKSLYITSKRSTPQPSATNCLLGGAGVHEDHVGVAALAGLQRLAGALRDHPHLDPGLLLEHRQDVPEEAGVLGRGGRGDGDELLRRAPAAPRAPAPGRPAVARSLMGRLPLLAFTTGSSPARKARASGDSRGRRRRPAPGPLSSSRPRCRKATSSASRRAWPRSWVVITTVMPSAARRRAIIASIARVAPGSSCGAGSSRNSTSGRSAQARASASRCCSPPDSSRAGRPARAVEAEARAAPPRRAPARRARGTPRQRQRVVEVAAGRAAQQHRPLEHHRLRPRRALGQRPDDRGPRSAAISPWQSRSSRLLPAPFGPRITSRRPARTVRSTPSSSARRRRRRSRAPRARSGRIDALGPHPVARRAHCAEPVGAGVEREA